MYLTERLRTFRSPLWDFVLGITDEDTLIHDIMVGTCCADTGGTEKIRLVLLGMEPKERIKALEELVTALRCARDCYARKDVPTNVDFYRIFFF